MRLFVQYNKDSKTGKGLFFNRIVPHLERLGCKCYYENKKCDITISPIRFRVDTGKMPKVLRIDGIHIMLDSKHGKIKDEVVRKDIKRADAVIWQSEFCKYMVCNILSAHPKREAVILNGANPQDYNVLPAKSDYKYNVILSSKWYTKDDERKTKRLHDMLCFAEEYTRQRKDVCFWVAGQTNNIQSDNKRIIMLGHLEQDKLASYLKLADVMLYLAWFDFCPNAVVESICAGTPVICGNNGGTPEIVKKSGIILEIDDLMTPQYSYNNVPSILNKKDIVLDALELAQNTNFMMDRVDLTAEYVARKYYNLFSEVLNGN